MVRRCNGAFVPSGPMATAFVIRLVSSGPADGRLIGQVEIVETGETLLFRDDADLVAVLRRAAQAGEDGT